MWGERSATRTNLPSRYAFSLVSAPLPKAANASGPYAARKASRRSATKSRAASHDAGTRWPERLRTRGASRRAGWSSKAAEVNPLMHIWPRLTGNSGSGRTSGVGATPACAPGRPVVVVTVIPHWNAQYGQCVRTVRAVTAWSRGRAIFEAGWRGALVRWGGGRSALGVVGRASNGGPWS